MINSASLAAAIQSQISSTVEQSIRDYVENLIQELALDSAWIEKIERQINEGIATKLSRRMSLVDVDTLVNNHLEMAVARYYERNKPAVTGVLDQAQKTELTVTDGVVKVENDLSARNITIESCADIKQTLTVQNLSVRGSIATDNRAWQQLSDDLASKTEKILNEQWRTSIIEEVTKAIVDRGIAFESVMLGNEKLVDGSVLASQIKHSNLETVGNLVSLSVAGPANIHNTLAVRPRRIGINTEHPEMALSVWDEEVSVVVGKHKEKTAYIGTARLQPLMIGVNRSPAIEITEQGNVSVKHLTVGRHRVCHEPECPNYSGTKGDIVFNSNPKNDGVWGWQCLGAFKWVALRSA